jgi:hypothetical protein
MDRDPLKGARTMQAAATTESDSQRLGTALFIIEAKLKEIGGASSVRSCS